MKKTLESFEELSSDNAPQVGIENFGESSIDIGLRYWAPTKKYFQLQYRVNMALYTAIREAGITIPYPQRDIHMIPSDA